MVVEPIEVQVPLALVGIDTGDILLAVPSHDRAVILYGLSSRTLLLESS